MANILDTTPITDTAQMPLKKGMLDFLQQAHMQSLAAVVESMIPNYSPITLYVIQNNFGITSNNTTTSYQPSGVIFYNGEIFPVNPAQVNIPHGSTQTAVATIQTTQYTTNADPVQFTDGNSYNVCNIRSILFVAGAPGSGHYCSKPYEVFHKCGAFPGSPPHKSTISLVSRLSN